MIPCPLKKVRSPVQFLDIIAWWIWNFSCAFDAHFDNTLLAITLLIILHFFRTTSNTMLNTLRRVNYPFFVRLENSCCDLIFRMLLKTMFFLFLYVILTADMMTNKMLYYQLLLSFILAIPYSAWLFWVFVGRWQ